MRIALLVLVLGAAGAGTAFVLLRAGPAPVVASPAPPGSGNGGVVVLGERGGTRWDPSRHEGPVHLRLETVGPRQARLWLEEELLGRIALDEQGRHSGEAIGRVMNVARLLANRKVIVADDPGLPPELARGVANLVRQGGCLRVEVQAR